MLDEGGASSANAPYDDFDQNLAAQQSATAASQVVVGGMFSRSISLGEDTHSLCIELPRFDLEQYIGNYSGTNYLR